MLCVNKEECVTLIITQYDQNSSGNPVLKRPDPVTVYMYTKI